MDTGSSRSRRIGVSFMSVIYVNNYIKYGDVGGKGEEKATIQLLEKNAIIALFESIPSTYITTLTSQ